MQALHVVGFEPGEQLVERAHRVGVEVLVPHVVARRARRGPQASQRVVLPERDPDREREPVPLRHRARDLQRLTRHVDAHRDLEQRSQQREEQAEARFLDHPWALRVESLQDRAERAEVLVAHVSGNGLDVEAAEPPPIESGVLEEAVTDAAHVLALPEPLRVLLVGLGGAALGTEVGAGHVEQARHRRGARPVHAEDDQLHGDSVGAGTTRTLMSPPPSRVRSGGRSTRRSR